LHYDVIYLNEGNNSRYYLSMMGCDVVFPAFYIVVPNMLSRDGLRQLFRKHLLLRKSPSLKRVFLYNVSDLEFESATSGITAIVYYL
jgi:hypothetical protein